MKYVNVTPGRRVWPKIQLPDGSTLELEAGETVDLGKMVVDPNLQAVRKTKQTKTKTPAKPSGDASTDEGDNR